jgi:proline dehydrogenase
VSIFDQAIARVLPAVPKPVVQRFSQRYIAGSTLGDAVDAVHRLNDEGKLATIDVLGEEISHEDEARAIARAYRDVFDAIERESLGSNVSIKLTALGLAVDPEPALENAEAVVRHAAESGNFVRIDMEESEYTTATIELYRELRRRGYDNVGVVLQSRLRRTLRDIRSLADLRPNVRLCKGIYLEPELIAYQGYQDVRDNFMAALDLLVQGGSYVGIATHDEWLLEQSLARVEGLGREEYELQMLLGVRPLRGDRLVREGHRLRIYTPYGREWHAYSMRRLKENPKIAGYIVSDLFGVNGK